MYRVPATAPSPQLWRIGVSWVIVSAFSIGVARPLTEQILTFAFRQGGWTIADNLTIWFWLTGLIYALLRALLRGMVLRQQFGRLRLWVPLNLAAVALLLLAAPPRDAVVAAAVARIGADAWRKPLAAALDGAIVGLVAGSAEWGALRHAVQGVRRTWRWIPATVIGAVIAQAGWELASRAGAAHPALPIGLEVLRSSITGWLLARFVAERAAGPPPADEPSF